MAERDATRQIVVPHQPIERVGMLVRDHQDPRATTEDLTKFWGVQQTFDRAIDNQVRRRERPNHGRILGDGLRCPRRPDRHRMRAGRRGHDHVEHLATKRLRSQSGRLNQHGATLRFA
jgi:hypothetical protein